MKEKILQALKTKYANLGFNEKALDGVAEFLTTSIKDENEIDNVTNGVESMLKMFQREQDSLRGGKTTAEKKIAELEAEIARLKPDKPQVTPPNNSNDEQIAKLLEAVSALTGKVQAMEGDKIAEVRRAEWSKLIGKLPEQLRKPYERITIDKMTDDEFKSLLNETTGEVDVTLKEYGQKKSVFGVPQVSTPGANQKASKEEIDKVMAGIKC